MERINFILRKVKVSKKTVTIDYTQIGSDKEFSETSKHIPHPDFKEALGVFKPAMVELLGMAAESANEDSFTINGIVCVDKKDLPYTMILTTFTTSIGTCTAINSPLINNDGDDWDFQQGMQGKINKVADECFEYLFNNKASQLQIPFDDNEE